MKEELLIKGWGVGGQRGLRVSQTVDRQNTCFKMMVCIELQKEHE